MTTLCNALPKLRYIKDKKTVTKNSHNNSILQNNPLWYKDAMIYQLHVRTFSDSQGDGMGDFNGLTKKLDYLQGLGVTALWLLPFCPSPLKDDGYDISDFRNIHPAYGNLRDFKLFLREAHKRGLRIITELVVNHTSNQHPWFQRSRHAKRGSKWRDFYVWSDTRDRYREARIIFQDFESSNWTWDPVANAYYWHRFYSHQPDLNYDNPRVQESMLRVLDFWFELGVDGLRLDAVPYLYQREGTNCENLPETHLFLKKMRSHVDAKFKNRIFLGEANQWPEDAVAYFGNKDECHMAFHFPLMPRLFMAIGMEDRFPILDIIEQTPNPPETCQWAIFLRNHDELTLEMVTEEERDYMYRVFAKDPRMRINLGIRRRLAPLLENNRRKIELMTSLLFSMPGTPIIYYGDEIGMGDNIYLGDRNGVRTPMQWSPDRNAGFSRANPQRLCLPVIIDPKYHYQVINVEAQENNRQSLLWWMKRLITLRKRYKSFSRGTIQFLHPDNNRILAFVRSDKEESVLIVANLSRFVQHVELDLSSYTGTTPVEIFGQFEFPPIDKDPYFLSLGPHGFYWFILLPEHIARETGKAPGLMPKPPLLTVEGEWDVLFRDEGRVSLENLLPDYLKKNRWFGGKARRIKSARIREVIPAPKAGASAYITLVEVAYLDYDTETYALPLTYATGDEAGELLHEHPQAVLAHLELRGAAGEKVLYDAMMDKDFCKALLKSIGSGRRKKGTEGELLITLSKAFRQQLRGISDEYLEPSVMKGEQSNTCVAYGEIFILKLIRRLDAGVNPDLEIGRFLTNKGFGHTPHVAGAVEYGNARDEPMTLAILQDFVPNQGNAWEYTLDALGYYFENVMAQRPGLLEQMSVPVASFPDLVTEPLPPELCELTGSFMENARLMGQRTAELHLALASAPDDPQFAPEPFSKLYQRSLYQSMRSLTGQIFRLLKDGINKLMEDVRHDVQDVLDLEKDILERFRAISDRKITAGRIRCHGDYHLGQLLFTGKDFVIIGFEGGPARPLTERRLKRSPLRDVAGMLRSFHYAVYSALLAHEARGFAGAQDSDYLGYCADYWYSWVCTVYLKSYLEAAAPGNFLPEAKEDLRVLLDAYMLEKAIHELAYEFTNRPDWLKIPIQGIRQMIRAI